MKSYMVESELGRFDCMLSIHTLESRQTNKRIKTAGYRRAISRLCVRESYRNAADTFNENYHRTGTSGELFYGTIAGDIEQEGMLLLQEKHQKTQGILKEFGFDPVTGLFPTTMFPKEYRNDICEMIVLDPEQFMKDITPGWSDERMLPDDLAMEEAAENVASDEKNIEKDSATETEPLNYSEPDTEEFKITPKRRGKRIEVVADEKEKTCTSFARWFNSVTKHRFYGIIHRWNIERDSKDVVCISIDAVYVDRQAATRKTSSQAREGDGVKGNNAKEEKEKRVGHMNVRIEYMEQSYYVTSTDTEEAFKEMIAVILQNGLYRKYMIFLTDGEMAINDKIKMYCGNWKYHVELDWIHLEHKCYDRLSNALKGKRVSDPRGEIEYYSRGEKKGQVKKQEYTSQSRLYARALSRILWAGNVDEAVFYLDHINPSIIKSRDELDQLKTYLLNKKDWIPCYALRKKAGLRNSSNGVEGQNNMNVAERQKNNGSSWRPEGSSYLASIKTMIDNREEELWFYNGKIDFKFKDFTVVI